MTLALIGTATIGSGSAMAGAPTAVAVDNNGFAFVGDADSGRIDVLKPEDGTVVRSFGSFGAGTGQLGPVAAIDVAPDNTVWIEEAAGPVSRLLQYSNAGAQLRAVTLPSCQSQIGPSPTTRGGIEATSTDVWIAHPCANATLRFRIASSDLQTGPSVANAKGVAVSADGSRVAFGISGTRQVRQFSTSGAYDPVGTTTPPYYPDSEAVDVRDIAFDGSRVLYTADAAQNKVRLVSEYGTETNAGEFRWLGGAGSDSGRLNQPVALDVFGQYGDSLAGNVWVADYGNNRVQRFNAYGYSFWSSVRAGGVVTPPGPVAPTNTTRPAVSGTPQVGQTLTCSTGTWTGSPTSFTYRFNRDGSAIGSFAASNQRTLTSDDAGHQLSCTVQATNAGGSAQATSDGVSVTGAPPAQSAPVNTSRPVIAGTPQVGQTLTCSSGTFSGNPAPTYAYAWRRNGTQVATGSSYTVAAADSGQSLLCRVTATNSVGSASADSDAVTPTTPSSPGRVGVTINDNAAATSSRAVTLTIREPSGTTSLLISDDGSFDNAQTLAVVGSKTYRWTLPTTGSDRLPKTVYVRFGSADTTYTDDIVLDQTAPTVTSATLAKSALRVSAKDTQTGVQFLQYAAARRGSYAQVAYKRSVRLTLVKARKATFVRAVDGAGNVSRWVKVKR